MSDTQLVLAVFPDEAAADQAVADLKDWNKGSYLRVGAIGVLVLDENGKLKEHKLGQTSGGKGAGIGLVLAALTPPTLIAGLVGGALVGHFHHKSLGLTDADRDRLGAELEGGKAAVGIIAKAKDTVAIAGELKALGGTPETYSVSDEAAEAVAAAVPAEPAETAPETAPAAETGGAEAAPESPTAEA
jgi:uncharacterized membrane protein